MLLFFIFYVFMLPLFCCSFSSRVNQVRGKEGFWRIIQDEKGIWWFLSPEGNIEFLNTVTSVKPFQKGRDENGQHYISHDWDGGLDKKRGNLDSWAQKTIQRVHQAGFKGMGAWCNPTLHMYDVAISRDLNLWAWAGRETLFYYPKWTALVEKAIQKQVITLKDNTNLIGYFIDNELGWKDGFSNPERYFNKLKADNPNRQEVVKVIRSIWKNIEDFNKDWQLDLKSWDELNSLKKLPRNPPRANVQLEKEWLLHLAKDYFCLTTKLIRKYDPNHLILGIRYKEYNAPAEVFKASQGFTDVQSINIYSSDAKLDHELFAAMYEESGQPIIISEYSFHSLDGRSGNNNLCGFSGGYVNDQQARAEGYKIFTTRLSRVPYIIGADWFQWNDEPPSGRSDGEDVNFGIVDVHDAPYEHMIQAIRKTEPLLNTLHANSTHKDQQDIWR